MKSSLFHCNSIHMVLLYVCFVILYYVIETTGSERKRDHFPTVEMKGVFTSFYLLVYFLLFLYSMYTHSQCIEIILLFVLLYQSLFIINCILFFNNKIFKIQILGTESSVYSMVFRSHNLYDTYFVDIVCIHRTHTQQDPFK